MPLTSSGFSLTRLDPLESKCNELIDLLKRADPLNSNKAIYPYISRHNMVHLCHLYGQNFQNNVPIIHSPTFDMVKAPPILLLAIMLVGACYSEDSIPAAQITKLAMQLLTVIGLEPVRGYMRNCANNYLRYQYETNMERPPISTIQAGILINCILACSKDDAALKSVRICFARNTSVCVLSWLCGESPD